FEKLPQKHLFWLDTMQLLCERLGHPENSAPCFHVAGSKGKGSVSTMIACILEEAGYAVGLYTSPHIADFRERVSTPHGFFDDSVYDDAASELMACVSSLGEDSPTRQVTWFELVTLYAFLCFRRAHVDYAVYEVGMGGRLDATNVVTPRACCITAIEREHTEYLGDTLEKIAAEKAGIIKAGVPVIVAAQKNAAVRDVFEKKATECGSSCIFVDDLTTFLEYSYIERNADSPDATDADGNLTDTDGNHADRMSGRRRERHITHSARDCTFSAASTPTDSADDDRANGGSVGTGGTIQTRHGCAAPLSNGRMFCNVKSVDRMWSLPAMRLSFESPLFSRRITTTLRLLGEAQARNAVQAALAVKTALPDISERAIERGLSRAALPARFEIVSQGASLPTVVYDGAHTVNSIESTIKTLKAVFPNAPRHALFACGADKRVDDIAPLFNDAFEQITVTTPGTAKQSDLAGAERAFKNAHVLCECMSDFEAAVRASFARAQSNGAVLLVVGSFYLVADVKKIALNL
ncbi:MAG: hypothetical protein IJ191_03385, partial [Treponema sp.]|nr:hypothetical protein [Treponema sp.]